MMQNEWEGTDWAGTSVPKTLSLPDETLTQFVTRLTRRAPRTQPWRVPSVRTALGVPSIQRAVSLIASTTGMLSVQGFNNGAVMDPAPRLLSRPDPYQTPQAFYGGTASSMAKYGEFVWWIANRDADGNPQALVLVPLNELTVEETSDRLMPTYIWGTKTGSRYSGANPQGNFVHAKYPLCEPLTLRGEGPLQLCKAAASVSVEAQEWAANFYAYGGNPSVVIRHAGVLSPERLNPDTYEPDDENGLNEAQRLKAEWMDTPHNVPKVVDSNIEDVNYHQPNEQGAQMLDARLRQDGEAALMFGIPGTMLEVWHSGSSITYQNLENEFTKFIRVCLQPLYLEPIEQALSDLLTRTVTARFNVKGFLRSDVKTRYEVHQIAITSGIYDASYAQREEGILPGDVEYAPVPFSPPAAIPSPIVRASLLHDWRCRSCGNKLLDAAGPGSIATCRRCKTRNELAA